MDYWVILLASWLMAGLVVAAVLLWLGVNAILHGRGLAQEAQVTIASLRRVLRSVYDDTVHQSLPDDFQRLLGKLTRHRPRAAQAGVSARAFN